jgi:hypothetical protein
MLYNLLEPVTLFHTPEAYSSIGVTKEFYRTKRLSKEEKLKVI